MDLQKNFSKLKNNLTATSWKEHGTSACVYSKSYQLSHTCLWTSLS